MKHLPAMCSDHRQILLDLGINCNVQCGARPFKFLAAWLTDDSFKDVVKKSWNQNPGWCYVADQFAKDVEVWNRDVFGNIFKKKTELMARINDIEKKLVCGRNRFLEKLQKQLCRDLECVLL